MPKDLFCCWRPGKQEEKIQNEASAGAGEYPITFKREVSGMQLDVIYIRKEGKEGGVTLDRKETVVSQVPNPDRILPQPLRPPFEVRNDSERQSQQARTLENSGSAIYLSNRPTTLRQIPSGTESGVTPISFSSEITFVHPLIQSKMEPQEDSVRDRERF